MTVQKPKRHHGERGQAIVETALLLPMFLIILFGVIWVIQQSVLNERMQIAVRYSGLVSNTSDMFSDYSLYSLYANIEDPGVTEPVGSCQVPTASEVENEAPFPGPASWPFWQPTSVSSPPCVPGTMVLNGSAFIQPAVFSNTQLQMSATTTTPSFLTLGNNALASSQTLNASENFFSAPDLYLLLKCFPGVQTAVGNSFNATDASTALPAPLPAVPVATALQTAC